MIDWIGLFNEAGVPWRNQGKNTSRRNINICCPFCGDDYGYHLACALSKNVYYCYREPAHSGGDLMKLVVALGLDRVQANRLLARYGSDGAVYHEEKKETTPQDDRWSRFIPIEEGQGQHAIRYLQERGFPNATEVAKRYDLRMASLGNWAARLLLPIVEGGSVVAWTGRDVTGKLTLKYKADDKLHTGMVYVPRVPRSKVVIVEGPLDALKIAAAQGEWAPIALMGKGLNPQKITRLSKLCRKTDQLLFAPDSDVEVSAYSMFDALAIAAPGKLELKRLPEHYKDPGDMSYSAIRRWFGESA